jgi:hypothetical protein
VTEWIVNNKWYGKTVRPRYTFDQALKSIDDALAARPPLTMGVLVNLAVHDYDNKRGLKVRVGNEAKTIFGDSHLGEGDTEQLVVAAVQAGVEEVKQAYQLGKDGKTFEEVKTLLLGGRTRYKAETLLPTLDPMAMRQPMPKWAVDTFDDLLTDGPMREALEMAVRNNVSEIEKVANSQKEPGKTAILKGFAERVRKAPLDELREIYFNDGQQTEKFLSRFDFAAVP